MIFVNNRGILLPKQREMKYSQLSRPRFHNLPKFQKGILHPLGFWQAAGGSITPAATDVTMTHNTPVGSGLAYTALAFHETLNVGGSDARVLTGQSGSAAADGWLDLGTDDNTVDHTGEWTTETIVDSEWEVAYTTLNSGAFTTLYAALGVYTALNNTDLVWRCDRLTGGKGRTTGTNSVNATFRIREVADTANFDDFNAILTATQN